MTEYSLRLAKPHCENCHKPKNDKIGESLGLSENILVTPLSLSERLNQTIQQANEEQEEEI